MDECPSNPFCLTSRKKNRKTRVCKAGVYCMVPTEEHTSTSVYSGSLTSFKPQSHLFYFWYISHTIDSNQMEMKYNRNIIPSLCLCVKIGRTFIFIPRRNGYPNCWIILVCLGVIFAIAPTISYFPSGYSAFPSVPSRLVSLFDTCSV